MEYPMIIKKLVDYISHSPISYSVAKLRDGQLVKKICEVAASTFASLKNLSIKIETRGDKIGIKELAFISCVALIFLSIIAISKSGILSAKKAANSNLNAARFTTM